MPAKHGFSVAWLEPLRDVAFSGSAILYMSFGSSFNINNYFKR